ncbi:MAG: ATP-binding protein [Alphaproteobacteria bacterium]
MIRCLIIEDNSFDRKVLRQAFKECVQDFMLHEVASIAEAERALIDQTFDCILLDFRLPDGDGLSFAKRFLAEGGSETALIMLTAVGNEQLAREALQLGILDYLPKQDLGPESLERSVSNALAKVRLMRERREALEELQRSNEALSRFASVVAHDLKAPIRQMKAFSGFLGEDYQNALDDDGQKLLRTIERAADRAFNLIDGMLAYARLGREGEARLQVGLRSAVDDAIANLADQIGETGAITQIEDLPDVIGVKSQLMQLFQNLISNALKFRHPERQLMISIACPRADANTVEITVRDNGIGVPREDQARIFEMLERLHSQDRYEGSGIGLATCRRIVENHGGRIWCRSEGDNGSSFNFTLEREVAAPEMEQPVARLDRSAVAPA